MAQLGFAEIARKCPCGSLLGFRGSECTFASGLKAAKRPRKIPFHPQALPFRNHCSNLYVSSPRNNWGIRVLALLKSSSGARPSVKKKKLSFSIIKAAVHFGTHPFNIIFLCLIRSSAYLILSFRHQKPSKVCLLSLDFRYR